MSALRGGAAPVPAARAGGIDTAVGDDLEAARDALLSRGWCRFGHDPALAAWVEAVLPHACAVATDPAARAAWLRSGGTWFAGVNILPNGPDGSVAGAGSLPSVPPLAGRAMRFLRHTMGHGALPLDTAQLSICYPGYPAAPQPDESPAAFRYRRTRDAAHVDGLERDAERRRRLGEAHAFILGIPLVETQPDAAPFSIWEGSHTLMRDAFHARLADVRVEAWAAEDVTDAYIDARRRVFETCTRVTLTAAPGEAYVAHRLSLHGVAPWPGPTGVDAWRPVIYFRPELPRRGSDGSPDFAAWLALP
ncbi:MAG: hypothetical protein AAF371_01080 [Pseudomonadota bacterium]